MYCNVISPTYVNGVKKQVLDIVKLSSDIEVNYFVNQKITFHEFLVNEVMSITLYLQTMEGENIYFDDNIHSVVIQLILK